MIEELYSTLTTLTEEAENAALQKCNELGLDTNRGVVSLEESFINLNSARNILLDAIDRQKLIQLPVTVQSTLLKNLTEISRGLTALANGSDEVVNLASAIEQLNLSMWQYGLHNLSPEVLGYQTKLNQLKNLELNILKTREELEAGLATKAELLTLLETSKRTVTTTSEDAAKINQDADAAAQQLESIVQHEQKSSAALANTQQSEVTSTQLLASTKTANAEVLAIEPKISEFFQETAENRTRMSQIIEDANDAVKNNKSATDTLIEELKSLEDQIKIQIQKATGFSLFHSFQTRQEALRGSKNQWVYILGALLLCSVGLSGYLVYTLQRTTRLDVEFFLKLSMSLPLFYAIGFCTVQYARERRLEEEYAFKSNISISLVPYQELVQKLVRTENPAEVDRYTAFIIESIGKVFSSPTDKIFDTPEKTKGVPAKALKQLSEILAPFIKEIRH